MGEFDVLCGVNEERCHLLRGQCAEALLPEVGRQDDHHAAPRAGHFVGQIVARDFFLNFSRRHGRLAARP